MFMANMIKLECLAVVALTRTALWHHSVEQFSNQSIVDDQKQQML
jgi:hypothetical protein